MMKIIAYETVVAIWTKGMGEAEFTAFLNEIHNIDPEDRDFDKKEKKWIIRNPEKFRYIHFIKKALEDRERQMTLFPM